MKRLSLAILLSGFLIGSGGDSFAQALDSGLPWSVAEEAAIKNSSEIPTIQALRPDYEQAIKEDRIDNQGAYRYGLMQEINVTLNSPSKIVYLEGGDIIWTTRIQIEDALATELFYKSFYLPKGVSMYLKNENGKQIVGALNSNYNPGEGEAYSTTFVEGSSVIIELNIEAGVNFNDIKLDIDGIVAHYRGGIALNLFQAYADDSKINNAERPLAAHPCHVNAVCDGWSTNYEDLSKTAASIYMGGSVCSGNLINNTGPDCTPLFLTASHCNGANATSDGAFNTWRFYFNYEFPQCTGNVPGSENMNDYIVGAKFKARSFYESFNPAIVGDFLLLELKDFSNKLGNEFGAYLAGWDRTETSPANTKFIGFHHPSGEPKKVVVFNRMRGNGNFNGGAAGSHWKLDELEVGGTEGGSSGSGIFSMSSRKLHGDLSGGPELSKPCDEPPYILNNSVYSKIDRNWLYESAGNNTASTRLKDWLDPIDSDVMTVETVKMPATGEDCPTENDFISGISDKKENLNSAVSVYPNPSSGTVFLKLNLSFKSDISIKVYNMLGVQVDEFKADQLSSGEIALDLNSQADGIYMISIETSRGSANKKVIINR